MASLEEKHMVFRSASDTNCPAYVLDWDKFDQSIQDVLGSGEAKTKRTRNDAVSWNSPSCSQERSGGHKAEASPAKRRKTERKTDGRRRRSWKRGSGKK